MTDQMKPKSDKEVDVMPTKALFVDMLTRDIPIDRAVIDLIDNSIDGARKLRGDDPLHGLEVLIEAGPDRFSISDNCGGISIDHARNFAFRFGRPKAAAQIPGAVGQFGVGMKRALFKFGNHFEVSSSTSSEKFSVIVDVETWKQEDTPWTFEFAEMETGLNNETTGTQITVSELHSSVRDAFSDPRFKLSLHRQIESAQQHYIARGLRIAFGGVTLLSTPWEILYGSGIAPAFVQKQMLSQGEQPVHVRIYAGIARSEPKNSGWYVMCNGRLLLEADQTAATGWSELAETAGIAIPRFHNQYARFRGFVFFDCNDTSRLPWNTTKTGVDEDSSLYRSVRLEMMALARPIIDFLNDLDAEKEYSNERDRVLSSAVSSAGLVKLPAVPARSTFSRPAARAAPQTVSIQYRRDKDEIEELQEAFGAASARATGERAFDFAYSKLVGDK